MAPNELPDPPPQSIDVGAWKMYVRYLWVDVELRDVKHERLTHHIEDHCQ